MLLIRKSKWLLSWLARLRPFKATPLSCGVAGQSRLLHALFQDSAQMVSMLSVDGTVLDANNVALDFIACGREDVVGKRFWETPWLGGEERQQLFVADLAAAASGLSVKRDVSLRSAAGHPHVFNFSLRPIAGDDGAVAHVLLEAYNITRLTDEQQRSRRLSDFYTTIRDTNLAIIHSSSELELLDECCSIMARNEHILGVWFGMLNADSGLLETVSAAGQLQERLLHLRLSIDDDSECRPGLILETARKRQSFVCNDFLSDPALAPSHDNARDAGCNAAASFPLFRGDQFAGVFALYTSRAGFFADDLLALLEGVAQHLSHALGTLQRQAQLRLWAKVFENSHEGVVIMDPALNILDVNPAFGVMTGYSSDEVIGTRALALKSGYYPKDFYSTIWSCVDKRGYWQGEILNQRKDGQLYTARVSISAVYDSDRQVSHYISILADMTDFKEAEERINYLASYDPLTNLPNRNLVAEQAELVIDRVSEQSQEMALLYLDLDHFKTINDSLGHDVGDALLQQVVERLKPRLEPSDIFGRLAGDEFMIVIANADSISIGALARKLLKEFERPFSVAGRMLNIRASMGIAMYPRDGRCFSELHQHADAAMHRAKELGRNCYYFFTPELNAAATRRLVLENQLRIAIRLGQLSLYYQPQLDIATGRLTGVEVLLRWFHPRLGTISPEVFIRVAEETGSIGEIGQWVLEEACRQFVRWRETGIAIPSLAVNVSTRQFGLGDLSLAISEVLKNTGMPAEALEIEITESLLSVDIPKTLKTMREIRALGVHIAVDDFGTGYSSLAYLKQFPLSKLKIDQSFVNDLDTDVGDRAIAEAIVTLGHSLSLKVTAEGVETQDQLEELRALGCDQAQGFYFSKPLPAEKLLEFVRDQTRLSCPSQ